MAVSDYTITKNGNIRLWGLLGRLDAVEPELLAGGARRPKLWVVRGYEDRGKTLTGIAYGHNALHSRVYLDFVGDRQWPIGQADRLVVI